MCSAAVFAATDKIAFGLLEAARQKDIDVPRQLAVIGFDDLQQASLCIPPLTTISMPWWRVITVAVESLIQLIEHDPCIMQIQITFKGHLEVRRSV